MTQHGFAVNLGGQISADDEDAIEIARVGGQLGNLTMRPGEKGMLESPGRWELYPQGELDEFLKFTRTMTSRRLADQNGYTPEPYIKEILESFSVTTNEATASVEPNYVVNNRWLCKISRTKAADNMKKFLSEATNLRSIHSSGMTPWVSPVPELDPVAADFHPEPRLMYNLTSGAPVLAQRSTLFTALMAKTLSDTEGSPEQSAAAITALVTLEKGSRAVHPLHIRSSRSEYLLAADPLNAVSTKHNSTSHDYLKEYRSYVMANKATIKAIQQIGFDQGVKTHGLDGLRSDETGALSGFANKQGGDMSVQHSFAGGVRGMVDAATQTIQVNWWHSHVTMWYAAYVWAVAVTTSKKAIGFTNDEIIALTRWVFGRSTYRRFFSSDMTLNSVRDISASEVTQAASHSVRWTRNMHPLALAMDDLEFAVTKKEPHVVGLLTSCYDKVLAAMMTRLGSEYGDYDSATMVFPAGEKLLKQQQTVECPDGLLFGRWRQTGNSDSIAPCDVAGSDAVLLRVDDNRLRTGQYVHVTSEVYTTVVQAMSGMSLTYHIPNMYAGVGKTKFLPFLTGQHYRESAYECPQPMLEFLAQFTTHYEPDKQNRVNKIRTFVDPNTTRVHHRHISLIGALAVSSYAWHPCLDSVLDWSDMNNTFLTALLLAMATLPPELYYLMTHWNGWAKCSSMAEYKAEAKALSTKMKALDNQVLVGSHSLDLSPLFEWEVLQHRAVTSGLLDKEVRDRRDVSQQIKISVEEARPEMDELFREIYVKSERDRRPGEENPLHQDFPKDFYPNRVQLTPGGSAYTLNGRMLEARRTLKANGVDNLTKAQLMAALPDDLTFEELMNTPCRVVAQSSFKFEWGKVRPLFAAPTEHWVVAALGLGNIEEYLPDDCPIGKAADAHRVCAKVMRMTQRGVTNCIDAANFNILHDHKLTREICLSALSVLGPVLSEDQRRALKWLADAEMKQYILIRAGDISPELEAEGRAYGWITDEVGEDGKTITLAHVLGGMFSGVRFTMLYNTILNRVYYRVAQKRAGIKTEALHSGDDVLAVFKSYLDAYKLKVAFKAINYTLQLSKCFMDGVREFLRISHKNANTSQYMARSCATAVHGRIESPSPTDFISYAGSLLRRGAELIVRHANRRLVLDMVKMQTGAACARWGIATHTWDAFLCLPNVFGGAAPRGTGSSTWAGYHIQRTAATKGSVVKYLATLPGVKKAAQAICDGLRIRKYHNRAQQAVGAAIAPKGVVMNYGMIVRWMTSKHMTALEKVVGKLSYLKQGRDYILAKSAGLFNALALNDNHWGNLTGHFTDIPSQWHPLALELALRRPEECKAAFANKVHELDSALNNEMTIMEVCNTVREIAKGACIQPFPWKLTKTW